MKSHFKCHLKSALNTNGRTDGLTKKVLTSRGDIALVDEREKQQKTTCICADQLDSCPNNCLLRWF